MNQQVLLKCQEMMIKLEMRPLYQYFLNNPDKKHKNTLNLSQIKNKLILNQYRTKEDWLNDLTTFFKRFLNKKKATSIQKRAAQTILDYINRKSKQMQCLETDDWISVFIHTYQEFANLIGEAPDKLNISDQARPMQITGSTIELSEQELIKMRNQLENDLNDKDKKLVAQLIISLEDDIAFDGKSVDFDLAKLKNDTLLAIRTFLNSHKSPSLSKTSSKVLQLFD